MNNKIEKFNIIYSQKSCDKVFILSKNGNGLILEKVLYDDLIEDKCCEELKYKLLLNSFYKTDRFEIRSLKPKISFFMIDFSTCCNLGCYYCLRDFISRGSVIKENELFAILDYIKNYVKSNGNRPITIQPWGGEPFLAYKEILKMDDFFKENNIKAEIVIQTNGTLITQEIAKELHDRKISVAVSIDGNEKIHNIHRKYFDGKDSYFKVIEGIKNLQKYNGYNVQTISVVTKMSLDYLEDSIISFAKDLKIKKIKLNFVHPNSDVFPMESVLTEKDIPMFYERLINILLKLYKEGYTITDMNIYDRIINLFKGWNSELCHSNGCLGGYKFITFSRDGNIYPCELVGNEIVKIGNIQDGDLTDILEKSIQSNPFFLKKNDFKCDKCPWYVYCRGGCTASIISYKKSFTEIDETQCSINEYLYPKLIEYALTNKKVIEILSLGEIKIED
ncbi:MAG: radical SAM protein [Bacilli bacterium]|nr:radical SAM protein [Bacilli bacterium]